MKRIISYLILILILGINCSCGQSSRDSWAKPDKVMDALGIKEGMVIGEIGAGEGYFTFHLSKRVGNNGKVYANDISTGALDKLKNKADREEIKNIKIILGELTDPKFPKENFDMIVMMYVFHDLEKPVEYLKSLRNYLDKGKWIVIIDRDPDKFGGEYDHFWKKDKIVKLVNEAGFEIDKIETFLPRDNIYIIK